MPRNTAPKTKRITTKKTTKTKSPKRLFLFAGYDSKCVMDTALIYYVQCLSKLGDVALYMDSDCSKTELARVKPYTIYAGATRHGEYDFGSYKRAYMHMYKHLSEYDFVYLVNDSVYGPTHDLKRSVTELESRNWDAFGMVYAPHKKHPHIQSWFIGMRPAVFQSDWFDEFLRGVVPQAGKGAVIRAYEHGFSRNLREHNVSHGALFSVAGSGTYNKIKKLYRAGMPFFKTLSITRKDGALGRQILYVLEHTNATAAKAIMTDIRRLYGDEYINWLLTKNPIKILCRNIKHILRKVFIEGI